MSRLYATATSEKASKGQGGNKYLNITLNIGEKPVYFIGLYSNGTFVLENIETKKELYRFNGE